MSDRRFPFTSVVGQQDAKLALQLLAVDPQIGGVLLRGEKGSAKTTLARGLADLLPGQAPFVDLPLGATEDRLIGSLDLTKALTDQEFNFTPGLLSAAHDGVLYIDEINLLADHLVDTLLDVAVSGVNRIERDGVSHRHDSRFVLIGSMNPEEGELRPQLLDRFGLSVQVVASTDPADRAEAVRRRLTFDDVGIAEGARPEGTADHDPAQKETDELRAAIASARPAKVPLDLINVAARLAVAVGAEGLRADIVLCRAAAANAALEGRDAATEDDLRRVAPLVLAHRSRRNPFDPPVLAPDDLADAIEDTLGQSPPESAEGSPEDAASGDPDGSTHDRSDAGEPERDDGAAPTVNMSAGDDRRPPATTITPRRPEAASAPGRRVMSESDRGRHVRDVAFDPDSVRPIAVTSTVRRLAERRAVDPDASLEPSDIRQSVKEHSAGSLLILVVDTSGSMGADARAQLATGTALGLLADAYERRDHVAVITFADDRSQVVLAPTGSIEVARNRLTNLQSGGTTPLADGLREALHLGQRRKDHGRIPFVVLISDGRASGTPTAIDDAVAAAEELRASGVDGLVLDCETSVPRLALAQRIADAMHSPCVSATDLDAARASSTIQTISRKALDAR